jgi:hypothetical protein
MTYFSSPSLIASAGHSLSQAPQAMHSSVITYAILSSPYLFYFYRPCEEALSSPFVILKELLF